MWAILTDGIIEVTGAVVVFGKKSCNLGAVLLFDFAIGRIMMFVFETSL